MNAGAIFVAAPSVDTKTFCVGLNQKCNILKGLEPSHLRKYNDFSKFTFSGVRRYMNESLEIK